jgi:hypothetical protein
MLLRPGLFLGTIMLISLLQSPRGLAQAAPGQQGTPPVHPVPNPTDRELVLAYWTTETGWKSELQLRNNQGAQDLTVIPVLRIANGSETALAPVTIKPQEVTAIDIDKAIGTTAPQLVGTYGSLLLRYRSSGSRSLYAALMVRNIGHPFAFHIDASVESQQYQAGSREGIWWLPKETTSDYLILTNQGQAILPVDLSLYDAAGGANRQNVLLGPHETVRYSVRKLLNAAHLTGSYGGIKVSASSHAGSLDTLHFLFDDTAGFAAILKMFDHNPNSNIEEMDFAGTGIWTLRAPMLALSNPDPALAFPSGTTLQPQLFIRNTSDQSASAALRFNWRTSSSTGSASGPSLRLNPHETRRIDVAALQSGGLLPKQANWTSVTLTTNGSPDDVVAVAASYDQTLRYGAQTPFSDQLSFKWAGGMWEYDPYHSSIITAGNGGTKTTQAAFTIFYNQGAEKYELEQTLQPDEQMWIDVGKLIREHVPDKTGKILPADLTSGSYEFRDLTDIGVGSLFEGKVIYDKTYGHAAYGCADCCAYDAATTIYDPLGIPFQGNSTNGVTALESCVGAYGDVSSYFYNNWSTANTAIATVNATGKHTGVAVGSTTSTTWANLIYSAYKPCVRKLWRPGGSDDVTKLSCPSSVTRGGSVTCSVSNPPTGSTFSNWKFTDSSNNTVAGSGSTSSWSGTMVTGGTVSVKVTASGGSTTLSAGITVTNRNWHINAASPTEVPNGTFITLPVPPQSGGTDSGLGYSSWRATFNGISYSTIADGGPNRGYTYWPSNLTFSTFNYQYEVNPDLENSNSTFSQHQCGKNGFISWSDLLTQTRRHEYNSTVQSHYAFYSNSLSSHNPGDYLEQQVAAPGANLNTFATNTNSGINSRFSTVQSDSAVEPYPVNYSETGTPLGNINYAPYTACN